MSDAEVWTEVEDDGVVKPTLAASITKSSASGEDTSSVDEVWNEVPNKDYSYTDSFEKGVEQGATLGFADEMKGGINAGLSAGQTLLHKLGIADNPSPYAVDEQMQADGFIMPDANGKSPYADARDDARVDYNAAQNANPKMNFLGNLAGGLITTPLAPAKLIAPLGSAAKMAPLAMDAVNVGRNVGIATKVAANSIPLSLVAGTGMSEGNNALDIAKDATMSAGVGAVLSPALHATIPLAGEKLGKIKDNMVEIADAIPGEPVTKFKLGLKGIIGISKTAKTKIEDIINTQVSMLKGKVDEVGLQRQLKANDMLKANASSVEQNHQELAALQNDLHEYKTNATRHANDEIKTIHADQKASLENQIKLKQAEIDARLEDYQENTYKVASDYEKQHQNVVDNYNRLKNNKAGVLDSTEPDDIARDVQDALLADKDYLSAGFESADGALLDNNIRFKIDKPVAKLTENIEGLVKGKSGDTADAIRKTNADIINQLYPYLTDGAIDRNSLKTLLNGSKNQYGTKDPSGLKILRNSIPKDMRYLYDNALRGLDKELRSAQDGQLRQLGYTALADEYQALNKGWSKYLELKDTFLPESLSREHPEYKSAIVTQVKDMGKRGVEDAATGRGASLYNLVNENADALPNFGTMKDRFDDYINRYKQNINATNLNENKIANIKNMLSDLKKYAHAPNERSHDPVIQNMLRANVNDENIMQGLQSKIGNENAYPLDVKNQLAAKEEFLADLKLPSPQNPVFVDKNLSIQNKLAEIKRLKEEAVGIMAPQKKDYAIDKLIGMGIEDQQKYLNGLIKAADRERQLGGLGSKTEELKKLVEDIGVDRATFDPQVKEMQDLIMAHGDDIDLALGSSGRTAGSISDIVGFGSNLLGKLMPNKIAGKGMGMLNQAADAVGNVKAIPTKNGAMSLEELMSSISNKPLEDVMKLDATGQAALKNSLIQISPEVRKYLEEKRAKNGQQ